MDLDQNFFVESFSTVSQMVEFSTMISTIKKTNNKTSFTRIKAIDQNYPLYGNVLIEPKSALKQLHHNEKSILVNENVFKKLNLKINDIIKLQDKKFKVIGIVKSLPDIGGAFVFGDFALTNKKAIDILKLKNFGSFLNYEYKVKFKKDVNKNEALKEVKQILSKEKNAR